MTVEMVGGMADVVSYAERKGVRVRLIDASAWT